MHDPRYSTLKRDPRSIWFKSSKAPRLSRADLLAVSAIVNRGLDDVYREIDNVEDDLRNSIPDDTTALQNDVESLEKRVSDIEYSQQED